jgi:hypothetical protein
MEGTQADSHGRDLGSLRADLKNRDPDRLAAYTGARSEEDAGRSFFITYWDSELKVSFPDFTVTHAKTDLVADERVETILLHYFHTADGTEKGDGWVSLAELPDGAFYRNAYQGYSGDYLASEIQNDLESFKGFGQRLGGKPEEFGDLSFSFYVLPRIDLLVVYHRGDDEFPPSTHFLFSLSPSHYLPTDIYAYLGRHLVVRILEARKMNE